MTNVPVTVRRPGSGGIRSSIAVHLPGKTAGFGGEAITLAACLAAAFFAAGFLAGAFFVAINKFSLRVVFTKQLFRKSPQIKTDQRALEKNYLSFIYVFFGQNVTKLINLLFRRRCP